MSNAEVHTERTMLNLVHSSWASTRDAPRFLVAEHVNEGAGYNYNRTLDAVVMDTWPSSGFQMHGIEVKVSKADLRRELQDISKSSAFFKHIDLFSIACPAEIADLSLLPPKWGLLVPDGKGKLKARRKPLALHDETRKDISISFMASFARALMARGMSAELLRQVREEAREEGRNAAEVDHARTTLLIKRFEEASGVLLSEEWDGGLIGEAVKFVMSQRIRDLDWEVKSIRRIAEKLEGAAETLEKINEASDAFKPKEMS